MDNNCTFGVYNKFEAVDNATQIIINYLFNNAPNFWKLLKYTNPDDFPYLMEDLTDDQKAETICSTPQDFYDADIVTKKNILFQQEIDEAFSVAVPQVRIYVGDIIGIDSYRGFANICFQVVVPNKQNAFMSMNNDMADRSLAISREIINALNGNQIENAQFHSVMFVNRTAPDGTGRSTGIFREKQNKNFSGYRLYFSVLI